MHLWPVTEANSLTQGIEPQKWPTPIALQWDRPDTSWGTQSACKQKGERPRVSDSAFLSGMSGEKYQKSQHGQIWPALCLLTLGNITAKWWGGWSVEEGGVVVGRRWRGRGYLRRIRETWWMTQYFHARGKLLHFKLEGVTERGGRRQRRKEINPQE